MIAYIFLGLGMFFMVFGTLGVLRFPDVYTRLQASSKCQATGVLAIFIGLVFYSGLSAITPRMLVITIFLLVTTPVASHAIGRAAYESGLEMWRKKRVKGTLK